MANSAFSVITERLLTSLVTGQSPFIYLWILSVALFTPYPQRTVQKNSSSVCVCVWMCVLCTGLGILGPLLTYCKVNN